MEPTSRSALLLAPLVVLVGLAMGCAHLTLGGPATLLDDAKAAMAKNDPVTAYGLLKRIATEYPDRPESREAFPLAADCLKALYYAHRVPDPESVWVTSEPEFMFHWLARYFNGAFPEQEANALFAGLSYEVFARFLHFAKSDPKLSRWKLTAEDDNGIVYAVSGTPAPAGPG